jgi:hypothetical protein
MNTRNLPVPGTSFMARLKWDLFRTSAEFQTLYYKTLATWCYGENGFKGKVTNKWDELHGWELRTKT